MKATTQDTSALFKQSGFWLFVASLALFLGKVLQSATSGTAIVEWLGYESWLSGLVGIWMPWEEYATQVYPRLSEGAACVWTVGYLIAFSGMLVPRFRKWTMWLGVFMLLLEAGMATAGQYYWLASFLEKSLMWITPALYLTSQNEPEDEKLSWIRAGRWAVTVVFTIHGLYALNVLPRPGYWIEMVNMSLGLSVEWAGSFLLWIGIMDILAASWIMFRPGSASRPVWYYLIGWGLLTALGRMVGYLSDSILADTLSNWGYETLIRLPHGLVPLALYLAIRQPRGQGSRPYAGVPD